MSVRVDWGMNAFHPCRSQSASHRDRHQCHDLAAHPHIPTRQGNHREFLTSVANHAAANLDHPSKVSRHPKCGLHRAGWTDRQMRPGKRSKLATRQSGSGFSSLVHEGQGNWLRVLARSWYRNGTASGTRGYGPALALWFRAGAFDSTLKAEFGVMRSRGRLVVLA